MKKHFLLVAGFTFLLVILLMQSGLQIDDAAAQAHVTTTFDCSAVSEIPQTECEALVALYNSTNGPSWTK